MRLSVKLDHILNFTKIPPRLVYTLLLLLALVLTWIGSRNRPDPVWQKANEIMVQPRLMIEDVVDSLGLLYAEVHHKPIKIGQIDSTGYKLLEKPRLRTLAWPRFRDFCRMAVQNNAVILSGVTGTGTTKLAEKTAMFIATYPEHNILSIHCAPEFDLELHKKYIGWEDESGQFQQGALLMFLEKCRQNPTQRFVCVIDNFDKINPETFFGPELWEKLGSPKEKSIIGGKEVVIPNNFFMFSVTHRGPGSRVEFNEEHIKRLGKPYIVQPDPTELLDYFKKGAVEIINDPKKDSTKIKEDLPALLSNINKRRMLYYFLKSNEMMNKQYGEGFELGQGSNVRKFYKEKDLNKLKETYINHINAIRGVKSLTMNDFESLDYTVTNNGIEPHTNFFERQIKILADTGYLVEITMVATTALLTTLIGYWIFRRREKMIRKFGKEAQQIYDDFEDEKISAEEAARRLEQIKSEVNDLVLKRSLNYTEGLYFMGFVDDKVRRIDFSRNVSENFLELFNAFMEDDVLTENEYQKLCQFLESMRNKIPVETYHTFIEKVEWAYRNKSANN
ncbi:MAG: hypothetical protein RIR11_3229 [Bacteroidota bacterium]